jgi:DNA adenine methylase
MTKQQKKNNTKIIDTENKNDINIKENIKETINDIKEKENIDYIKPLIKWVGGKTQIINNIIAEFPDKIDNYHELFLGGGSVLFALLQNVKTEKIIVKKKIYAYDLNETLINMYKNIQTKHKDILTEINKLINDYNSIKTEDINRKPKTLDEAKTSKESYYYWIRSEFNELEQEDKNKPLGSAYFIFLNKTCFRGVYREGPHGFNVPFGHYKSPEIINEQHLEKVSNLIKNVKFIHSDFEKSFEKIKPNDFIYLDPPYVPENATSFVGYTSDGFSLKKHEKLFELCKEHNFVMSNSDVDLVKNSFDNKEKFDIKIISCKRSINSKKPDSKTNEVIIKTI